MDKNWVWGGPHTRPCLYSLDSHIHMYAYTSTYILIGAPSLFYCCFFLSLPQAPSYTRPLIPPHTHIPTTVHTRGSSVSIITTIQYPLLPPITLYIYCCPYSSIPEAVQPLFVSPQCALPALGDRNRQKGHSCCCCLHSNPPTHLLSQSVSQSVSPL